MRASWKDPTSSDHSLFWPSVADMAVATCMMFVIFWIGETWLTNRMRKDVDDKDEKIGFLQDRLTEMQVKLEKLETLFANISNGGIDIATVATDLQEALEREAQSKKKIQELVEQLAELEKRARGLQDVAKERIELLAEVKRLREAIALHAVHNEPPNIVLADSENYTFPSGSAVVGHLFAEKFIESEMPSVVQALNSPSNVEVVEIIGHTDFQAVSSNRSNLDEMLPNVFDGSSNPEELRIASNCELGLARAIAVKHLLEQCFEKLRLEGNADLTPKGRERLSKIDVKTYSAAQLFPLTAFPVKSSVGSDLDPEDFTKDRRIEIRFTRLRTDDP